jgi:WD40 repeat protein
MLQRSVLAVLLLTSTAVGQSSGGRGDPSPPARERQLPDPLQGHTNTVLSMAFSPDGQTLASGDERTTIKLWDVPAAGSTARSL